MTTYTVYDFNGRAESGLTKAEAIREIYTDDGAEFRLVPEMEESVDDDGNDLPATQESSGDGDLIWRVQFKRQNSSWASSPRFAFGQYLEKAELRFLESSFDECAYDSSRWTVVPDAQYEAEQRASDQENAADDAGEMAD